MKDFRPRWQELAKNKQITFSDTIQRAILIGMAKGETIEDQIQIAESILDRSSSPSKKHDYMNLERGLRDVYPGSGLSRELDLTEEESKTFVKIRNGIKTSNLGKFYSYIFIFGRLIPEQTLVQGMHASMQLGSLLTAQAKWPNGVDASNLHFVVVSKTLEEIPEIKQLLARGNISSLEYHDHDYAFGENGDLVESPKKKSLKSIMTRPIPNWKRKIFEGQELLRFG